MPEIRRNLIFEQAQVDEKPVKLQFHRMLQDEQGFLWMDQGGLVRFDGRQIKRFNPVHLDGSEPDPEDRVGTWDLCLDHQGFIWVATHGRGLQRFDPRKESFEIFALNPDDTLGAGTNVVWSVFEDSRHRLWVGTRGEGVYLISADRDSVRNFRHDPDRPGSLSTNMAGGAFEDSQNRIWISPLFQGVHLYEEESGTFQHLLFETGEDERNAANKISDIIEDENGRLWMPTWHGLVVLDPGDLSFQRFFHDPSDPLSLSSNNLRSILMDSRRNILMGSDNGINVFDPGRGFIHYQADEKNGNSLSTNSITLHRGLFEDREGTIWISAYPAVLNKADPYTNNFEFLAPAHFLENREADSRIQMIYEDRDGLLWLAAYGLGVYRFDPKTGAGELFGPEAGNPNAISDQPVTRMLQDRTGTLWVTNFSGLYFYEPEKGYFQQYCYVYPDQCDSFRRPVAINEDRKGWLWFSGNGSGLHRMDPATRQLKTYPYEPDNPEGLGIHIINDIVEDQHGRLWLKGEGGGLHHFDPETEQFTRIKQIDGLPENRDASELRPLLLDSENFLWFFTKPGPVRLQVDARGEVVQLKTLELPEWKQLQRISIDQQGQLWAESAEWIARLHPESGLYDRITYYGDVGWGGWVMHSRSGAIFSPGQYGIYRFSPDRIRRNDRPPTVVLTDFQIAKKPLPVRGTAADTLEQASPLLEAIPYAASVELTHRQNDLSFAFAVLNYTQPEKNRYKYMLENYKADTIYTAADEAFAIYTNLDHGDYTFKVWGANNEGVWSTQPASLGISILPPWWLTWWAKVLYVLAGVAGMRGIVQWRTSTLRERQKVLEQTVAERTAEVVAQKEELAVKNEVITKEKERSEELLLNILPAEIAEELKLNGASPARNFDQVTVLFTDFKQFTTISEQLTAQELVSEINTCFKAFDEIITRYGIEKIKTIGDAYMAAGGLHLPQRSKPRDVVLAALEMQQFMRRRQKEREGQGKPYFEMRCGIHTGPVVAGIVGVKKFQYDIWGDTVNTASRMESSGEVGKVNISDFTYSIVKDDPLFVFAPRGKIKAKHKGEVEMYYVGVKS